MRTIFSLRLVLLTAACLFSLVEVSKAADDEQTQRRARYDTLKNEYLSQEAEARGPLRDPGKPVKPGPSAEDFARRFMTLVRENPADEVACDALIWVATKNYRQHVSQDAAFELLEKHHLTSVKLREIVPHLGVSEIGERLLVRLTTEGAEPEVRGPACFHWGMRRYARYATAVKADPNDLAESERLLARVMKDYADVRFPDLNSPLGEMTQGYLYEIRNLQPGMKAPEIVGRSIDDKPMKLSDYRGKVVLLAFWSIRSGGFGSQLATPFPNPFPEHRKLMRVFAGRPLTFVGVCLAHDRKQAAEAVAHERITWPSFLDGPDQKWPISEQWNVGIFASLPKYFLIGADGVILRNANYWGVLELADPATFEPAVRQAERK